MSAFREAFPILYVDDVEEAMDFYGSIFGFEETFRHEEAGRPVFAFLRLEPLGIGVALRPEDDERDFAVWIYAEEAEGVDEAARNLRAAGADEVMPPSDQPWGERVCSFVDPHGHLVHVGAKAGVTS